MIWYLDDQKNGSGDWLLSDVHTSLAAIPVISAVAGNNDIADSATGVAITGTDLAGATNVTINGVTQSNFSAGATPTFDLVWPNALYGTSITLDLRDGGGSLDTHAVTISPASGRSYATISGYSAAAVGSITALAAIADGDQIEYETLTTTGWTVTVNAQGRFTLQDLGGATPGNYGTFQVRIIDQSDGTQGAWATQTASDTIPTAFSFTDQTNVALSTVITSDAITVAGINAAAVISVDSGEYRIDGGSWTSAAGTVTNGQQVELRHTSSDTFGTAFNQTLTIGSVSDTFRSTTLAQDITPDQFTFTDQINVALSAVIVSNQITVSGINDAAPITILNGEYSINGGAYTSAAGSVVNGDTVTVRHTSNASNSTPTDTTLTIGGVSDVFTSTTISTTGDSTPDAFSFTAQSGVAVNITIESESITPTGFNSAASISVSNGEYSINGTSWVSTSGTLNPGDSVQVRHTSSVSLGSSVTTTLNIGGITGNFTSTTTGADTTPDAVNFTNLTDQPLATLVESNIVTLSGLNTTAAISITNGVGDYRINGGSWTNADGTVSNGDTVQLRHITNAGFSLSVTQAVTIGTLSTTFASTTLARDTTPDAFSFNPIVNASLSTVQTSGSINVSGINAATNISVTGGEYSVNGGAFTTASGTVNDGDSVQVRHTSSAAYSTQTNTTLTIGSVQATFRSTTTGDPATTVLFPILRTVAWDEGNVPDLVIGDTFWHLATLSQGSPSAAYDFSAASSVRVAIVSSDHTRKLTGYATLTNSTSGADWASGIASVYMGGTLTAEAGTYITGVTLAKLEIELTIAGNTYTWFAPVRLIPGYLN